MDSDQDFYDATVETILVPIRVAYQAGTGVLYTYEMPTRDTIKNAMQASHGVNLTNARQGVSEAARLLRTLAAGDRRMAVVLEYLNAAGSALGLPEATGFSEAPASGTRLNQETVATVRTDAIKRTVAA